MKAFISGDFETKYERTVFRKIPGRDPEVSCHQAVIQAVTAVMQALFYAESGRLVERLGLADLTRYSVFF